MLYIFISNGSEVGVGTEAELAEYIANGWVPADTVLGQAA